MSFEKHRRPLEPNLYSEVFGIEKPNLILNLILRATSGECLMTTRKLA